MSSFTVSLTGNTSTLAASFYPEIILDEKYNYSCGLLDLATYHSIPNITLTNNKLYYQIAEKDERCITVPVGCYEAIDILKYLKAALAEENISFQFTLNKNTLKTTIKCNKSLIFNKSDSIHQVLGYKCSGIIANDEKESEDLVKITNLNVLRVECNIVSGAYVNGKPHHSIYEFASNKVDAGYKIIERPRNVIYMPIVPRRIDYIQITIVDQNGELVDFRGEDITCRIHIKRDEK